MSIFLKFILSKNELYLRFEAYGCIRSKKSAKTESFIYDPKSQRITPDKKDKKHMIPKIKRN